MNIAVLVFNGVELVDMNGPLDVFLHANRFNVAPFYNVYTVAATPVPIISEGGVVTIIPQYTFETCPDPELIVIPGRIGNDADSTSIPAKPEVVEYVRQMAGKGKLILSVCVGLYTLAETGLLAGRKATTHYLAIDYVESHYKGIDMIKNVRYVHDDNFITTGGITSGIDGALYVVEQYNGPDVALKVANIMVYNREAALPPGTILPLHDQSAS
ncbi:DJ-1/PfpI family protein [Pedobacter steynii]|uniref:DJ-1/PfpI family protein n=1 Tax=Pedobacter steynii TaxID=430522 RepID=A0A1G9RLI0_9SPHI|nr:DJ-1/PfpI family protein [Pedobacter steynii]NQX37715.1 DJ-1/PfpI family protein [Pedobacter steynii]SDM24189.1 DJ-1/PfpI family protein [Pedobacter steynii]